MSARLEQTYRAYLDALNERRFDEVGRFLQDELTYNDSVITREQYVAARVEDVRVIPDVRFDPHLLVVGDDHVACRLWFDCTPRHAFLGVEATGRRITFAEHVFYRFRDDRIEHVWSLLDVDAIRRQLTVPAAARPD